jgi:hypothetical protein
MTTPSARRAGIASRPALAIFGAVAAFVTLSGIAWMASSPETEPELETIPAAPTSPPVVVHEPKVTPVDPAEMLEAPATKPELAADEAESPEKPTKKSVPHRPAPSPKDARRVPKAERDFGF